MGNVLKRFRVFLKTIGPGFITGAADDDPSGVGTYSLVGARFGYGLNWMTLFSLPMMIAVQEACARIGIVTGKGLVGVLNKYYPRKLLYLAVFLLALANVVNIGADLGAMASVLTMMAGFKWWFWLVLVTLLTVCMEIMVSYRIYKHSRW